jgi:hypothetical protein
MIVSHFRYYGADYDSRSSIAAPMPGRRRQHAGFNQFWAMGLGSGPKGSAVLQWDGRVPFTWQEGEVVKA